MGKQRATSQKRQREAAKEAKATAKRERRHQAKAEAEAPDGHEPLEVAPAVVLERLAEAHRQFRDDEITFEEYDLTKADLLRQLRVD